MNKPILFALLAVTATAAFAANLKDPAQVAREWNNTIEQARDSGPDFLNPMTLNPTKPMNLEPQGITPTQRVRLEGDLIEVPQGMMIDPHLVHGTPGTMPPPGAKPWYYRGQKFWIIPIGGQTEAK